MARKDPKKNSLAKTAMEKAHEEELRQAELSAQKSAEDAAAKRLEEAEDSEMEELPKGVEAPVIERRYTGQESVDSDLYKLEVAIMKKNVALRPHKEKPDWKYFEHTHVFRTYDSAGRKQEACSPVGGHFHEVVIKSNPKGGVPIIEISGPKKKITVGSGENSREEVIDVPGDSHTHKIAYLRSDKIQKRVMDKQVLSFVNEVGKRQNPPEPK